MTGTDTPGGSASPPVALPPGLNDPCIKCRREPRKPGQRWGKDCHAAYMRLDRRRKKQTRIELVGLVGRIRAEVPGWPP